MLFVGYPSMGPHGKFNSCLVLYYYRAVIINLTSSPRPNPIGYLYLSTGQ